GQAEGSPVAARGNAANCTRRRRGARRASPAVRRLLDLCRGPAVRPTAARGGGEQWQQQRGSPATAAGQRSAAGGGGGGAEVGGRGKARGRSQSEDGRGAAEGRSGRSGEG